VTVNDWPERKWTLGLRQQPVSDADGDWEANGAVEYELICCYCGDDPQLRYGEVPAGLQQVRGPYRVKAGIEAFLEHDKSHEPAAGEHTPLLAACSPGKETCSGDSRRRHGTRKG
jgi:hypothetical protein